jgi:hypothetical protein
MEYAAPGNTDLLIWKLCFGTIPFADGRGLFKAIRTVDQAGADELVKTSMTAASTSVIRRTITLGDHVSGTSQEISSHLRQEKPMPELSRIDPGSAALLVMDYQVDTLTRFRTSAESADAIAGNYVTVAQRVPVRIDFDRTSDRNLGSDFNAEGLLKPGLSVEPEVRVR